MSTVLLATIAVHAEDPKSELLIWSKADAGQTDGKQRSFPVTCSEIEVEASAAVEGVPSNAQFGDPLTHHCQELIKRGINLSSFPECIAFVTTVAPAAGESPRPSFGPIAKACCESLVRRHIDISHEPIRNLDIGLSFSVRNRQKKAG